MHGVGMALWHTAIAPTPLVLGGAILSRLVGVP